MEDDEPNEVESITIHAAAAAAEAALNAAEAAEERAVAARAALAAANETFAEAERYAYACEQAIAAAPSNREAAILLAMQLEDSIPQYEAGAQRVAAAAAAIQEESEKASRFAAGARRAGAKWAMNATRKAKQLESDCLEAKNATQQAVQAVVNVRAQAEAAVAQVEAAMDEETLCGPRAVEAQDAAMAAIEMAEAAARECEVAETAAAKAAALSEAARKREKSVRALNSLKNHDLRRGFAGWEERWHELLHEQMLKQRAVTNMLQRQIKRGYWQWNEAKEDLMYNAELFSRGVAHHTKVELRRGMALWYERRCERRRILTMAETAQRNAAALGQKHGFWGWVECCIQLAHDNRLLGTASARFRARELTPCWLGWKETYYALQHKEGDDQRIGERHCMRYVMGKWCRQAARAVAVQRTLLVTIQRMRQMRLAAGWSTWRTGDANRAAAMDSLHHAVSHWHHSKLGPAMTQWHAQTVWKAVLMRKLRSGDEALLRLTSAIGSRQLANSFIRWSTAVTMRKGTGSDFMSVAARYFGKSGGAPALPPVAAPPPIVSNKQRLLDEAAEAEERAFWRQMNAIQSGGAPTAAPGRLSPLSTPNSARPAPKSPAHSIDPEHARPASARPGRISPFSPALETTPLHRPAPDRSSLLHRANVARAKRSARVRAI